MKKCVLSVLVLFVLSIQLRAQQNDFLKQQTEFAVYNIGLNGLIGGLGAVIHKEKEQKGIKTFWRGFKHGAIGGGFIVLGKQATFQIHDKQNLSYGWLAKFTSSIGNSIVSNAAHNRPYWEKWQMNLPFVRTEYNFVEKKFKARIMPTHLATAIILGRQSKINWGKSFQIGALYYEAPRNLVFSNSNAIGLAVFNGFGIDTSLSAQQQITTAAHEMVHVLQYDNTIWGNLAFTNLNQRWQEASPLYNTLSKIFYLDFNGLLVGINGKIQSRLPWHCRPMERESNHFAYKVLMPRCE